MAAICVGSACDEAPLETEDRVRFGDEDLEHPEVVMLETPVDGGTALCTGSFVTATRILTAAHCVDDLVGPPSGITVVTDRRAVRATDVDVHPGWVPGEVDFYPSADRDRARAMGLDAPVYLGTVDLAIVHVAAGASAGITPAEIAGGPTLSPDDIVTIVGFGRDESETSGTRRTGTARFVRALPARMPDGALGLAGVSLAIEPHDGVIGCSGDSGGPLFDHAGRIAGVYANFVASGSVSDALGECNGTLNNIYTMPGPFSNWIFGETNPHQNESIRLDVTRDGAIAPNDALAIIRSLNRDGARALDPDAPSDLDLDVNGDGYVAPNDALALIRQLNFGSAS
ncbi:MAG: trypsin-like serine protease [Myxococcota bacterium]